MSTHEAAKTNKKTGEITETFHDEWGNIVKEPKLNQQLFKYYRRKDGSIRIQQDFSFSPSLAEQHTAHLTDINYLVKKYKPDELGAYMAARNQYRQEILGHDFSQELTLQEAKNVVYRSQQEFESLPEELKYSFKNHVEFLKFIDNPANAEKLIRSGYITKQQLQNLQSMEKVPASDQTPPTTEQSGGMAAKGPAKPKTSSEAE